MNGAQYLTIPRRTASFACSKCGRSVFRVITKRQQCVVVDATVSGGREATDAHGGRGVHHRPICERARNA